MRRHFECFDTLSFVKLSSPEIRTFFAKTNRFCSVFEVEEDTNCFLFFAIYFIGLCFNFGESGTLHGEKQLVIFGRFRPFEGILHRECVCSHQMGNSLVVWHALLKLLLFLRQFISFLLQLISLRHKICFFSIRSLKLLVELTMSSDMLIFPLSGCQTLFIELIARFCELCL